MDRNDLRMEKNKLLPFLSNEKILLDLAHQITKDIGVEGFVVLPVQPSAAVFEELFNQLFPLIENLDSENKAKLNFIINRSDISEVQLKKEIQKNKSKSYAQLLTELIIKRELQKVVIRSIHK